MPAGGCGNLHLKTINHIRARDGETGAISVSRPFVSSDTIACGSSETRREKLSICRILRRRRRYATHPAGMCMCEKERERERAHTGARGRNGRPISSRYRSDLTAARYRKPRSRLFRARRITRPAKYADLPSSVTTQGPPRSIV